MREVLKVAALPDGAATRDRAASWLTGDCTVRISCSHNHSLSGTTWVACFRSHVGGSDRFSMTGGAEYDDHSSVPLSAGTSASSP
jgi:hypothetical protein